MLRFEDTNILTAKDVGHLLGVSYKTACKHFNDIRNDLNVRAVTYHHFKLFFKLN